MIFLNPEIFEFPDKNRLTFFMVSEQKRLQDIPSKAAHFCLEVERFVRSELQLDLKGCSVLLGLSGGADSTALFLVMHLLRPRLGLKLHAAHLNHMLRAEAGQEQAFVLDVCKRYGVGCYSGESRVDKYARKTGLGQEHAARIIRYRFLSGVARRNGDDYILLGHHLNDLAEDVLMRLIRGTGWPEITGMPALSGKILRPFLLCPKKDIYSFLRLMGEKWKEDSSNADQSFTRNRVRQDILPLFLRENPNFLQQVRSLWKQGELDRSFFSRYTEGVPVFPERYTAVLKGSELDKFHPALRLRIYKRILEKLGPGQPLFENVLKLDRAWVSGEGGKCLQFPGDKEARIFKKGIFFGFKGEAPSNRQ